MINIEILQLIIILIWEAKTYSRHTYAEQSLNVLYITVFRILFSLLVEKNRSQTVQSYSLHDSNNHCYDSLKISSSKISIVMVIESHFLFFT